MVFRTVLDRRSLDTGLVLVLPLLGTLAFLRLFFEVVEALGLGLLQIVWRHWDLLHIFYFISIFLDALR